MARQLTVDFGRYGIRANVLCPGWIVTNVQDPDETSDHSISHMAAELIQPVGRRGLPIDVARAATFLASNEASFIAGAVLVVDGGLTVQTPGNLFNVLLRIT
jgi:3-oxoacyl-[acyl-carrier protein] reductase